MYAILTSLTEASTPILWGIALLLGVPLCVALFHPDDKRSRRAHAILRDLLNALRRNR